MRTKGQAPPQNVDVVFNFNISPRRVISELVHVLLA